MSFVDSLKRLLLKVSGLSLIELNGLIILMPLILLIIFSQPLYRVIFDKAELIDNSAKLDSLLAGMKVSEYALPDHVDSAIELKSPFGFDPNKATQKDFLDLGFNRMNANRMIAYRNTGATYRYKEDLLRIREIDTLLVKYLWDYILLPGKPIEVEIERNNEIKQPVLFDINSADTVSLKKIYGIGSVLSARIVAYRQKLGGFISMNQLAEVYGLNPEVIEKLNEKYLVSEDFIPGKLNINQFDEEYLSQHPYIDKKTARAIIAYRMQHGSFKSVEELSNIYLIDDALLMKILPYIEI
jgi:competence protein ComEA